ncbi:MAG: hypothetical protein M3Y27_13060, partial [Acidobacteriota bacterium]|nr:hypothetical protein [Acidobacteriota bacterium]
YYSSGQNLSPWGGQLLDGSYAGRTITTFFSPDFQHWAGGRALSFHRAGYVTKPIGMGQEAHMGGGLWNRGNVILGLYGRWYGDQITGKRGRLDGLTIDIGFIISNDAIHYREPIQDFVFLERGHDGQWDSVALLQANAFNNTDTETQIWYSHWDTGAPWPLPALPQKVHNPTPSAIGLATLPRDRFGYVAKQYTELPARGTQEPLLPQSGELLTKSIVLGNASQVFVNVTDVSAEARLTMDLVNDAEETLRGYSSEITAPGLKQPVHWSGGKIAPAGQPFRIRVRWPFGRANPKLYVIYVEKR